MSNFPPLRMAVLNALIDLKQGIQADKNFLDGSPYDDEVNQILYALFEPKVVEVVVEKEVSVPAKSGRGRPRKDVELSEEDKEKVRKEITDLIGALNDMGTGEDLETNERLQVIKAKTNLVNQLLQMRERNTTSQKMEEFMSVVMNILESLVSEKDREVFLQKLNAYR